eukprot:scaffold67774_cov23-Cyclotella_meneghiniana.AAC.2
MPVFRTIQDLIIKRLPCSVSDYFLGKIPESQSASDWRIPHQSDMDVGEMFLNYQLHHSKRHFFGARIATEEGDGGDVVDHARIWPSKDTQGLSSLLLAA